MRGGGSQFRREQQRRLGDSAHHESFRAPSGATSPFASEGGGISKLAFPSKPANEHVPAPHPLSFRPPSSEMFLSQRGGGISKRWFPSEPARRHALSLWRDEGEPFDYAPAPAFAAAPAGSPERPARAFSAFGRAGRRTTDAHALPLRSARPPERPVRTAWPGGRSRAGPIERLDRSSGAGRARNLNAWASF